MIETIEPSEKIVWKSSKIQKKFIESQADICAIGGAAGGGKSDAIIIGAGVRRLLFKGTTGGIVRNFLPDLEGAEGIIPRIKELFSGVGVWKEQKKEFHFPSHKSLIKFYYADGDDEIYRKFRSLQFADLWVDQAEGFTGNQLMLMYHRVRTTKNIKPFLRLSFNPCGIGHEYLLRNFIYPSYGDDPLPEKIYGKHHKWDIVLRDGSRETREFIPATFRDNPDQKISQDYKKKLLQLPDNIREAFMDGRWDVFKGQFFTEFKEKDHVGDLPFDKNLQHFESIDWGFNAPFCCLFFQRELDGTIYVYDEIYKQGLVYNEQAERVLAKRKEWGVKPFICKIDPASLGKRDGNTGITLLEEYARYGLYCAPASNKRIDGWIIVKKMLKFNQIIISPRCENLIETLPQMQYDKNKANEDLKKMQEDHACDALRYGLADERPIKREIQKPENMYSYDYLMRSNKKTKNFTTQMIRDTEVIR